MNTTTDDTDLHDPDDMFKDSRMSIGDHIEDLRTHLLRAIKGFAIGMVFGLWPVGPWLLDIIKKPVEDQLNGFEQRKLDREIDEAMKKAEKNELTVQPIDVKITLDRQELIDGINGKDPVLDPTIRGFAKMILDQGGDEVLPEDLRKPKSSITLKAKIANPLDFSNDVAKIQVRVKKHQLSTMSILESFMVWMKVSMLAGLVMSSPWVFYHIWAFFAAGLYPEEKRLVNIYLPISLVLFIGGVLLCQFAVMPNAVKAMLWFNEWLGLSADLRLNEWLSFALMMPVVFGICFQTPLVMMFIHKIGLITVQGYRSYRRISWFSMAIFAALILPSVDAPSLLMLWVPMVLLYELGILLCIYQGEEEKSAEEEDEAKSKELVEV
jgi:sec-independent protein translocase protein TatC